LSYNCNVVVAEKYVPPVITVSFIFAIFHLAFSLVTPLTPSIVEPVHALTKIVPASVLFSQVQTVPSNPKAPEV
jgi:Fe2+ transport system protein B